METHIRAATAADLPALVALLEGGSLAPGKEDVGDLPAYRAAWAEIEATPGNHVLVLADKDGTLLGTCQLLIFRHLQNHGGRCAEIEAMHVAAGVRGHGLGGVLLEHAVGLAREAGCYRIQLTSNLGRPDAHRFYARHGFVASHHGFKRMLAIPSAAHP